MISLIVAYAKNRVIGMDGKIPWRIKGEQTRFRKLTMGNTVIMGRRTFEEIGKPLPNRQTIVLSKRQIYKGENCITVCDLENALLEAKGREIFIAGGASLYAEAIQLVERMYITEIDYVVDGDTFFPGFSEEIFVKTFEQRHDEAEIPYSYLTYQRK